MNIAAVVDTTLWMLLVSILCRFALAGSLEIPRMIYGTAWKKDRTTALVKQAISEGFRAFDTANQPRHYNETLLGRALQETLSDNRPGLNRQDFWIQTKFTPDACKDQPVELHPYDEAADVQTQVQQSFASSLHHLGVSYIDSFILHAPYAEDEKTLIAWREMEKIHRSGQATHIGVSNFNLEQLRVLVKSAAVQPAFVQNRCLLKDSWNKDVREFCKENGILYQGFWLLTGNPVVTSHEVVLAIASRYSKTPQQVVYQYLLQDLGVIPLTGTKDTEHMSQDLEVAKGKLLLTMDDLHQISAIQAPKYTAQDPVAVTFISALDAQLGVFWKDPANGGLVPQGEMTRNGQTLHVNAFHSHTFVVKRAEEVVLHFQADRENGAKQSKQVDSSLEVDFKNIGTQGALEVFWVSQNQQEVSQGKIQPGRSLSISSYLGHHFAVKDEAGQRVGEWTAKPLTPGKQHVQFSGSEQKSLEL